MRSDGLRRTGVVALREISERARTKAFRISTAVALLAVVALVVLPARLAGGTPSYHVGMAGTVAAGTTDVLTAQAQAAKARLTASSYPSLAAGEQALRDRAIDVLVVDGSTLEWRQRPDPALATLVSTAARTVQIRDRAARLGLTEQQAQSLLAPIPMTDRRLVSTSGLGENAQEIGLGAVILVFLAVAMYGNVVLTGVAQEKSSRVAEVLLARMRPRELLAGKVLGIGALGLAQFALVATTAGIATRVVSDPEIPTVPVPTLVWLVVWFVLGYALYSVVYAGLGALTSRVEDASNAAAPASVLLFGGYAATLAAMNAPDSPMTTVLSFLPPTAPFVMPLRITVVSVPAWQLVAAALMTAAAVWLLVLVAARLYTGGLLRTGARVPLRVAWRGAERI
jgi:ABC-2 type transport system permease protein